MPAEIGPDRWFYKGPDGKHGPVSQRELRQLLFQRAIPAESPVWRHGLETWTPAIAIAEFRAAILAEPAPGQQAQAPRRSRLSLPIAAVAAAACVVAVVMARSARPVAIQPSSLREQLIVIGRSADLEAMPTVISAVADPDAAVASTAVVVAEALLGVRYSDADRKNPTALAGKITADWRATQEQMRRRQVGKDSKAL